MVCSQFKLSPIAAIISLSALTSFSVLADDAKAQKEEESIERISVYGASYRNTATKSKLSPIETPQSIKVIDQKELQMRGADSIIKAMRYVSGVTTENRGGTVSRFDEYKIRGFENYNNYWDGLILPFNNWNIQPQIDAFSIDSIEVLKGPSSVLYGNASPGGMINLVPKEPQMDSQHVMQVRAGNRNMKEFGVDSTGQIGSSDLNYRITSLYHQRDGQAETTENERYFVAPSLAWQITDSTYLKVYGYYQRDPKAGAHSSLPGAGTYAPNSNGQLSENTFIGDVNWDRYDREVSFLGYKVSHQINDHWSFMQNARYMYAEGYTENVYGVGFQEGSDRLLNRLAYRADESTKSYTIDNQFAATLQQGLIEHNLLFGLDYQNHEFNVIYDRILTNGFNLLEQVQPIDIYNRNNHQIDRSKVVSINDTVQKTDFSQVGYYFQDQMKVEDFVAIFGLRYDKVQQDINASNLDIGKVKAERTVRPDFYIGKNETYDQEKLSLRLGALYTFDNGLAPYLSYTEGFEAASGLDENGNSLKPIISEQTEAGIKFTTESKATSITFAYFDINKENVITYQPNTGKKKQTGLINSKGFEIEAELAPIDDLLITASYADLDAKVEKDENPSLVGKTPTWFADENVALWVDYYFSRSFLEGLNIGSGVRYIGQRQVDSQNTTQLPSSTVYDFAVSYDFGTKVPAMSGVSMTLSVNNITDERYVASCYDAGACWLGAERSIEAGVRYEF